MPELPEVETTRRSLAPALEGATIESISVARLRMLRRQANPDDFSRRLTGQRIVEVGRHGKFLMTQLANDIVWVTHLGMSGRVSLVGHSADVLPHSNVIVSLSTGTDFRLIDPRTFGFVAAFTSEELAESSIGRLGRDALFDLPRSRELAALLAARRAPIKALLLDQLIVAGIGNIYADESLHRARISPLREGGSLQPTEIQALRKAVRETLQHALRWGGTSLDDLAYLLPDGRTGDYVNRLRAYGREGEPCRRCGAEIARTVIRARSSFWCPGCQS
ncbi:MAG: bifunctional DNA-formamidopyrimidine glycosylase/DNA-(apurinic or apyrimidinic site) lyase [Acidimicrobiia bacterium]|nr:bifunctional DNA-formamidopyrimidine glycosylase/DNA-(apurinic or apyrimidinic site) lyase [Acidimicrobiia bacterium]